ncbi:hypothetical protein GmHk_06G017902 [Glycine max]|nr:hypothetical protein GmHk_06G017902 [Glycine max]
MSNKLCIVGGILLRNKGDGKQKKKVHAYMKSIAWFDRGSKFGEENTCMFVLIAFHDITVRDEVTDEMADTP